MTDSRGHEDIFSGGLSGWTNDKLTLERVAAREAGKQDSHSKSSTTGLLISISPLFFQETS